LLLDILLQLRVLPLVLFTEFFDIHHDHVLLVDVALWSHAKIERSVVKPDPLPSGVAKSVLTFFPVKHTNALDRAVVRNQLAETPSMGRSNRLGGRSNRLGQERRRKPRFAAPGATPSGIVCLGLS
jgi:hypothetical protein